MNNDEPLISKIEVNQAALYWYSFVIGIAMFQIFWAVCGNAQTAPIIIAKFGWNDEEAKYYNTLITAFPVVGVFFGSLIGGKLITFGRTKAILYL